jgi:hypothetical protein
MKREPRQGGGVLTKSALAGILARLLVGLLRLLPWALARLLRRLPRIAGLPALLRLALVVLAHVKSPKLPKYNLNAYHSNHRTYLCSMRTIASATRRYIF